jgi:hypothetical protein
VEAAGCMSECVSVCVREWVRKAYTLRTHTHIPCLISCQQLVLRQPLCAMRWLVVVWVYLGVLTIHQDQGLLDAIAVVAHLNPT